jgi:hypothetical protein
MCLLLGGGGNGVYLKKGGKIKLQYICSTMYRKNAFLWVLQGSGPALLGSILSFFCNIILEIIVGERFPFSLP